MKRSHLLILLIWVAMIGTNTEVQALDRLPDPYVNDLSADQVRGNITPSAWMQTIYTVTITNRGTRANDRYSVKLFGNYSTELGSVSGRMIQPGQSLEYTIPYAPTGTTITHLRAQVLNPDDENPANDNSPTLSIYIKTNQATFSGIADGYISQNWPINVYQRTSLYQVIYYPEELGVAGTITGVSFKNNFSQHASSHTKVWIGVTNKGDLGEAMIPTTMFTQVYDGVVNCPYGWNTVSIPFQVPYVYAGGNLVLTVYRPMDYQPYYINNSFYGTYLQSNRSRNTSGSMAINPADPPTNTLLSSFVPFTTFTFTHSSIPWNTLVYPQIKKFGVRGPGSETHQTVKLFNGGNDVAEITAIDLIGSSSFALQHRGELPLIIFPARYHEFSVRYAPMEPGEHRAMIRIERSGLGLANLIDLSGFCEPQELSILPYRESFDRDTAPRLPSNWSTLNLSSAAPARVSASSTSYRSPPNSACMFNAGDGGAPLYLITPRLDGIAQASLLRIKFAARADYPMNVLLGSMLSPLDADSFTAQQTFELSAHWNFFWADIPLLGEHIAFKHGGVVSSVGIYIDDVWLGGIPTHDLSPLLISGNRSPSVDQLTSHTVTVKNWGTVTESDYFVELYIGDGELIGRLSGSALGSGETAEYRFDWVPQTEGTQAIWAKTVLRMDENTQNDRGDDFPLWVQPSGETHLYVGEEDLLSRIPVDMSAQNSLYQVILRHDELFSAYGYITGITLYNDYVAELSSRPLKVWVGNTGLEDLAAGWIPASELELAFDGLMDFPIGRQSVFIPFLQPLDYRDGQNLVLMINRPWEIFTYSMWNTFVCRVAEPNRALGYASSINAIDPMIPVDGVPSNVVPVLTLHLQAGGVGDLGGRVFDQYSVPLAGVLIKLMPGDLETDTDSNGAYRFDNLISGEYSLELDRFGYRPWQAQVLVPNGGMLVSDAYLNAYPRIQITGRIVASDTGNGLANAVIELGGYQDLTAVSDLSGAFAFADVCGEVLYSYQISVENYSILEGLWLPGGQHFDAGTIILSELSYPANYVRAELEDSVGVKISWRAPDSYAGEIDESFEEQSFPPSGWDHAVVNAGSANAQGVFPTWCRIPAVTVGGSTAQPTEGLYQAGLWWSYEHQDEWLISPTLNCPPDAILSFDTYVYMGSAAGDHYSVKVSTDQGSSWTTLWDASTLTGGWNMYDAPVSISLADYAGQQIILAWHAEDSDDNLGLWYVWLIDAVYVGNAAGRMPLRIDDFQSFSAVKTSDQGIGTPGFSRSGMHNPRSRKSFQSGDETRVQLGYRVYRLREGQEQTPDSWISLAETGLNQLEHTDPSWAGLPDGNYRWAVRALHTAGVVSVAAFSNILTKQNTIGNLAGIVRSPSAQPLAGATVSTGNYSAVTNNAGAYSMILPVGSYEVTASANGYLSYTASDVTIYEGLTTTQNFVLHPGSEDGEEAIVPPKTALYANYPNPFNPSTTISFSLRQSQRVNLTIYDIRGRRVKTLRDAVLTAGKHYLIWDGCDSDGRNVGGGVYLLRMQAGSDSFSRKMLLMK